MCGKSRLGMVYSTECGSVCPACGKAQAACTCRPEKPLSVGGGGTVRVGRETKGRKGAGVTVISGLCLSADGLKKLATRLKQGCSCGGTVKNGIIEIQGDHRDYILAELVKEGFKAKRAGG